VLGHPGTALERSQVIECGNSIGMGEKYDLELSTGQKLAKIDGKGFHENYDIQNMKPYESDYSNPPNLAAPLRLAWGTSELFGFVFGCPVSR
jgi:hypothetical protein